MIEFERCVALEIAHGFLRIGIAGLDIGIAEHVQSRWKIRIDVENTFHHLPGAGVVLLEVKPFCGEIQHVLITRESFAQIVHCVDRGEIVRFLNVEQPVDEELLVRSCGGQQCTGALDRFGSRLVAVCGIAPDRIRQRKVRIAHRRLLCTCDGIVEHDVFILVDRFLDQLSSFIGPSGDRKDAKQRAGPDCGNRAGFRVS